MLFYLIFHRVLPQLYVVLPEIIAECASLSKQVLMACDYNLVVLLHQPDSIKHLTIILDHSLFYLLKLTPQQSHLHFLLSCLPVIFILNYHPLFECTHIVAVDQCLYKTKSNLYSHLLCEFLECLKSSRTFTDLLSIRM